MIAIRVFLILLPFSVSRARARGVVAQSDWTIKDIEAASRRTRAYSDEGRQTVIVNTSTNEGAALDRVPA
jgi:hypothetical protein